MVLGTSRFGESMAYACSQCEAMLSYLDVPQAELDDNPIERALRSVVMGRHNWLRVVKEVQDVG
ncbi:MAG: transposase [Verrucomicrobiota bacterium]